MAVASVAPNTLNYQEFVYDFAVHGGAVGSVEIGVLPLGAVVLAMRGVVETPIASTGSATITVGTTDVAGAWLATTAKTLLDAQYDVFGQAVCPSLVQCNDTASRNVLVAVGTEVITAFKARFGFIYYVPSNNLS
jgi:hypothetical protein